MRPQDRFIFETFTDIWQNVPDEINSSSLDRGFMISYMFDFPIGLSNFSFAVGVNYASHNYYTKNHLFARVEDSELYNFHKPEGIEIERARLSLNYISAPVELRYFVKSLPKTLRIHAGIRGGYLVNGFTKYSGKKDYGDNNFDVVFREYNLNNLENFLIGTTLRLGYGRINAFGFFPLTRIFKDNDAVEMFPVSLGFSLILF